MRVINKDVLRAVYRSLILFQKKNLTQDFQEICITKNQCVMISYYLCMCVFKRLNGERGGINM